MNITEQDLPNLLGKKILHKGLNKSGTLVTLTTNTAAKFEIKAFPSNPAITGWETWDVVPQGLALELQPHKYNEGQLEIWVKYPPRGGGRSGGGGGGPAKADPVKTASIEFSNDNNTAAAILSDAVKIHVHAQEPGKPFDFNALDAIARNLLALHGNLVKELQERRK